MLESELRARDCREEEPQRPESGPGNRAEEGHSAQCCPFECQCPVCQPASAGPITGISCAWITGNAEHCRPPSAAPLSNSKQQQPSWLWLGVPDSGAPATARHWWRAQSATAIDLKRSSSIAVGSSVVPCTAGCTGSQRPCGGSDRQAGLHWRGPAVRRYTTFETAHLS